MLNVKALVGAFNQEKALVGAFSVIVQLHLIDLRHYLIVFFVLVPTETLVPQVPLLEGDHPAPVQLQVTHRLLHPQQLQLVQLVQLAAPGPGEQLAEQLRHVGAAVPELEARAGLRHPVLHTAHTHTLVTCMEVSINDDIFLLQIMLPT